MPPPKYSKPNFSPYGRYLIDVRTRKDNPLFHDTQGNIEGCNVESIPTGQMSRFDTKAWAIERGFIACPTCMDTP